METKELLLKYFENLNAFGSKVTANYEGGGESDGAGHFPLSFEGKKENCLLKFQGSDGKGFALTENCFVILDEAETDKDKVYPLKNIKSFALDSEPGSKKARLITANDETEVLSLAGMRNSDLFVKKFNGFINEMNEKITPVPIKEVNTASDQTVNDTLKNETRTSEAAQSKTTSSKNADNTEKQSKASYALGCLVWIVIIFLFLNWRFDLLGKFKSSSFKNLNMQEIYLDYAEKNNIEYVSDFSYLNSDAGIFLSQYPENIINKEEDTLTLCKYEIPLLYDMNDKLQNMSFSEFENNPQVWRDVFFDDSSSLLVEKAFNDLKEIVPDTIKQTESRLIENISNSGISFNPKKLGQDYSLLKEEKMSDSDAKLLRSRYQSLGEDEQMKGILKICNIDYDDYVPDEGYKLILDRENEGNINVLFYQINKNWKFFIYVD